MDNDQQDRLLALSHRERGQVYGGRGTRGLVRRAVREPPLPRPYTFSLLVRSVPFSVPSVPLWFNPVVPRPTAHRPCPIITSTLAIPALEET